MAKGKKKEQEPVSCGYVPKVDPSKKVVPRPWTKVDRGGGGLTKTALVDEGKAELAREARFLEVLADTGIAPKLLKKTESQLTLEDVGSGEKVQDGEAFVMNSILLLNELRAHKIRHGDLTSRNVIVRGDRPIAIDFGQSTFVDEGGPYKRPKPDAYYFWKAVASLVPDNRPLLRWEIVRKDLGGDEDGAWDCLAKRTVTDLGCYTGESLAMAVAEGAEGEGVDQLPGPVAIAKDRWGRFGCHFTQFDLMGITRLPLSDIVFLFSTWSYMVQRGRTKAEGFLHDLIQKSKVLFFETQLHGDGPGPEFLKTHDDVGKLLGKYGDAKKLATLPVGGRSAERSVWSVR